MTVIDEILDLYRRKGDATYGEGVSQTEHALQSALLAETENASAELVSAALLHDIGHLLHDLPEDIASRGLDAQHESIASAWLSRHFGPAVTEPVRLHVDAKRYLCRAEPGYWERLSDASKLSLTVQGGALTAETTKAFAEGPFAEAALRLRRWDDEAKIIGLATPDLDHFRPYIEAVLKG
jgi:[1-hydroxy-2-(trimethylamino)ethyl]phosphonate dioxygenase